jgi:hypothetical protein
MLVEHWEKTWLATQVLIIYQMSIDFSKEPIDNLLTGTHHSKNQQNPYGLSIEFSNFHKLPR